MKCVSLVTNSMSNAELFAMRLRPSLMQSPSFKGPWPLKRCQATNVHDEAPDWYVHARTCMQERANQCAWNCDPVSKILQCGIGITRRLLRRTATTGCRQRSAPARARAVRRGYQPINFLVAPVRLLQRSTFF